MIMQDVNVTGKLDERYTGTLCCFCSSSVNLKLFYNTKFVKINLDKMENYMVTLPAKGVKAIIFLVFWVSSQWLFIQMQNSYRSYFHTPCFFHLYPRNFPYKYTDLPHFLFNIFYYEKNVKTYRKLVWLGINIHMLPPIFPRFLL